MAKRTATTAHALLGLLALRSEWSTWELTQQLRRNMRFFWPRAESQIYEEAKSLVARGWARDRRTFTGERPRTSYSISAAGRRALTGWLSSAPKPTSLECEPLLRVLFADFGSPEQVRAALDQVRADGHAILDVGRVVGAEYLAGVAPFQDQLHVRSLVLDFLSHHARMLIDWADRTEATLDAYPESGSESRRQAALSSIAANLDAYPSPLHEVPTGPGH